MPKFKREILNKIKAVTNKRARFVLDSIVARGIVTTEEISRAGYEHPPRAARDVRELGFPLKTLRVKHTNGRTIAAYTLAADGRYEQGRTGRRPLAKKSREAIIEALGARCSICESITNLQIDHRIPYQVAGESVNSADPYQLLCGSCNRKKSWSCEHCSNWLDARKVETCRTCYWAGSTEYSHIALAPERRLELVWRRDEITDFEHLKTMAKRKGTTIIDEIKAALRAHAE